MDGEPASSNFIQEIASEKALAYIAGLYDESRGLTQGQLVRIKRIEIEAGLSVSVSADEWLSAAIGNLVDEEAFGYSNECVAFALGCSPETVRRILEDPAQVDVSEKYETCGRLARLRSLFIR